MGVNFQVRRLCTAARNDLGYVRAHPRDAAKYLLYQTVHLVGNAAITAGSTYAVSRVAGKTPSETINGLAQDVKDLANSVQTYPDIFAAGLILAGALLKRVANVYLAPSRVERIEPDPSSGRGESPQQPAKAKDSSKGGYELSSGSDTEAEDLSKIGRPKKTATPPRSESPARTQDRKSGSPERSKAATPLRSESPVKADQPSERPIGEPEQRADRSRSRSPARQASGGADETHEELRAKRSASQSPSRTKRQHVETPSDVEEPRPPSSESLRALVDCFGAQRLQLSGEEESTRRTPPIERRDDISEGFDGRQLATTTDASLPLAAEQGRHGSGNGSASGNEGVD